MNNFDFTHCARSVPCIESDESQLCYYFWFSQPPETVLKGDGRRIITKYTSIYHGYVTGIISLQVMRDGEPQLVRTVRLRTSTAVHLFFALPSRCFFLLWPVL